jgi:heptosyltransferase II
MASTQSNKILVLGPAWIGDMVMAQSLFKTLKLQQPNCEITVAAPAWTLPLLDRMPEVSQKIALPFKHGELAFWERIRFGKSLRTKGYQQAIILTNSLKSALLPWAAGITQRTSFLGEMRYGLINDIRPLDKKILKKTVERFVALGLAKNQTLSTTLPQPKLIADMANGEACLKRFAIVKKDLPILGLCPGAEYGESKRWPATHYAEVANAALQNGWQVWLFGSEKDTLYTNEINVLANKQCIDFGGKTKLGEAIDLMAMCNTIVSNDSGLMHVAAALDKKLIAIFGSSDPKHTPPMSSNAVIEYLGLECSPCFKRECHLTDSTKILKCLRDIHPVTISAIAFKKT